jgi:group I intron endonuclease
MKYYIYQTTNLKNGKIYIGYHASENIENDSYLGSGKLLRKAIKKHGKENFIREILFEYNTSEEAFAKELEIVNEEFVEREDTYNIWPGGVGGSLPGDKSPFFGKKHTDESKRKMSENNYMKGKHHTEETKEKLSKAHSGKILSDETKEKLSKNSYMKGKHHNEETKEKLRLANVGQKRSAEARKLMSENSGNKGKPKSEEFKKHLSEKLTGQPHPWNLEINRNPEKIKKTVEKKLGVKLSEEHCKSISEGRKGKTTGKDNYKYIGDYITPYGIFSSSSIAAKALGLFSNTIYKRCVFSHNKISDQAIKGEKNKDLIPYHGKTYREAGWWFEPKNKENTI